MPIDGDGNGGVYLCLCQWKNVLQFPFSNCQNKSSYFSFNIFSVRDVTCLFHSTKKPSKFHFNVHKTSASQKYFRERCKSKQVNSDTTMAANTFQYKIGCHYKRGRVHHFEEKKRYFIIYQKNNMYLSQRDLRLKKKVIPRCPQPGNIGVILNSECILGAYYVRPYRAWKFRSNFEATLGSFFRIQNGVKLTNWF